MTNFVQQILESNRPTEQKTAIANNYETYRFLIRNLGGHPGTVTELKTGSFQLKFTRPDKTNGYLIFGPDNSIGILDHPYPER